MNDSQKLIVIRKIINKAGQSDNDSKDFFDGVLYAIATIITMKEEDEKNAK